MLKTISLQADNRIVVFNGDADILDSYRKKFYEQVDFMEAYETFFSSVFKVTSEWLDKAERLASDVGLLPSVVNNA